MAIVYITEFAQPGLAFGYPLSQAAEPALANQTVAIGGASVQSSAVNSNTMILRVHTDAICSVDIGSNPTATATKRRLAANTTEYFQIPTNQAFKVAVITNT